MNPKERKVVIELSEHDAFRLLTLIQNELGQGDQVWQTYWERLAQHVKAGIEQAGYNIYHRSTCSGDQP